MSNVRYQSLGPLLSGEGSRAFLGLEITAEASAQPIVLVWLPDEVVKDADALQAVQKETLRASQLDHPNIIRVEGLARQREGVARVVEYADGESLRRILEACQRLPAPLAALIAADAAMGLHYAHLAGNDDGTPLIHADIRPETLLVSYSGLTKVSGYGALAVAPREAGGRRVRGRRHHCAPEQVLGGRNAVNIQTDVYLTGLLLFECITGQVPFEDEPSEADFDQAVLAKPCPELPLELCPPALAQVIRKAISKRAADRPSSTLALRDEIIEALGGQLAEHAELSAFLREFFPESHPTRAARRRALELGLQNFASMLASGPMPIRDLPGGATDPDLPAVRSDPERTIPASTAAVQAAISAQAAAASTRPALGSPGDPAAPTEPAAAIPRPVAIPALHAAPHAPLFSSTTGERSTGPGRLGWGVALVGLLAVGGAAGIWVARRADAPPLPEVTQTEAFEPAPLIEEPEAPAELVAAPDAGGEGELAEGEDLEGDEEDPPVEGEAEAQAEAEAEQDAPNRPSTRLALHVEPRVEVFIKGKKVGYSPLRIRLEPGRHLVRLVSRRHGINTTRVVRVEPQGTTTEHVYLRKGYVNIEAPEGSEVFLNGRKIGQAPLREVGVYEGSHKLLVVVAGNRWQEAFEMVPNRRLNFTVDFQ